MSVVSPIYGGLLALLTIYLSVRVSLARREHKISVGDGDNPALIKAIRTHANSIEYIPLGIILLILLELQNGEPWLVHLSGLALLFGRVLHAYGLGRQPQFIPGRVYGAYLTLFAITGAALANIYYAVG
ncbi:MAG: MAPEG family protein [Paracoccaceae bacterium]